MAIAVGGALLVLFLYGLVVRNRGWVARPPGFVGAR